MRVPASPLTVAHCTFRPRRLFGVHRRLRTRRGLRVPRVFWGKHEICRGGCSSGAACALAVGSDCCRRPCARCGQRRRRARENATPSRGKVQALPDIDLEGVPSDNHQDHRGCLADHHSGEYADSQTFSKSISWIGGFAYGFGRWLSQCRASPGEDSKLPLQITNLPRGFQLTVYEKGFITQDRYIIHPSSFFSP